MTRLAPNDKTSTQMTRLAPNDKSSTQWQDRGGWVPGETRRVNKKRAPGPGSQGPGTLEKYNDTAAPSAIASKMRIRSRWEDLHRRWELDHQKALAIPFPMVHTPPSAKKPNKFSYMPPQAKRIPDFDIFMHALLANMSSIGLLEPWKDNKKNRSFHICLLRPNGYKIWTSLCMHYWQKCRPLDSWSNISSKTGKNQNKHTKH